MSYRSKEISYDGCLFRSYTEARWAVFFDELKIAYEYESEGFVLDNGEWYLPDFWLPELRLWVEVKGAVPTDVELNKLCNVYQNIPNSQALFLFGQPCYEEKHGVSIELPDFESNGREWYHLDSAIFTACRKCEYGLFIEDWNFGVFPIADCICDPDEFSYKYYPSPQILQAYKSACTYAFTPTMD